jgi:hypothetical protein
MITFHPRNFLHPIHYGMNKLACHVMDMMICWAIRVKYQMKYRFWQLCYTYF